MSIRLPPAVATAAAAVGSGTILGVLATLAKDVAGGGPAALPAVVAAGVLALRRGGTPQLRGAGVALGGAVVAALVAWQAESVLRGLVAVVGPVDLAAWALLLAWAVARLLGAPFRAPLDRTHRLHAALAAVGFAVAFLVPREVALGFILVNGLVTEMVSSPLRSLRARLPSGGLWRAGAAGGVVGAATLLVAVARPGLAPGPASWAWALGGVLTGLALGLHGALVGVGLALAAGLGAVVVVAPARLAGHELSAFAAFGLATGMIVGALRPWRGGRHAVPLGVAGGLLLLGEVPSDPLLPLALADRTVADLDRSDVEHLRSTFGHPEAWAGPGGIAALHHDGERVLVEADGTVLGQEGHSYAAQGFAGLLGGCVTSGRSRARVGGDTFGLAAGALRTQGFLLVDAATPLPALTRGLADVLPEARRTWLHPSVRLLALPGPALVQLGERADVVVDLVAHPWSDGGSRVPDARALASIHRTLAPDGAYILALGLPRVGEAGLDGLLHTFGAEFDAASLWLAPDGVDTVLLVGTDHPVAWAGLAACRAADPDRARRLHVSTDLDLGALAHADDDALTARAAGGRIPDELPEGLAAAARPPTAILPTLTADPARVFDAAAPLDELRARAAGRLEFLRYVAAAAAGQPGGTLPGDLVGGSRALDPVTAPLLKEARAAFSAAKVEGLTSKAWQAADNAVRAAVAIAPRSAPAWCLAGEIAAARAQFDVALLDLQTCTELDPSSGGAWHELMLVRRAKGDLVGAETAAREGVKANPTRWESLLDLGYLLVELGRYADAEPSLRRAAEVAARAGDAAGPHLALAALYLKTDRAPMALVEAENALTLQATADGWYYHGAANYELGHTSIAARDFRKALELDAGHVNARGGLGLTQELDGDYTAAALSFQAVLAADPQNGVARQHLQAVLPKVDPEALRTPQPPR